MSEEQLPVPKWGLKDIRQHWKDDLKAGISVSVVALPLGLGIALASGVPAMSGILPAIIGGILTTFIRSSSVAINGPSAGQIVVVLTGMELLRDENGVAFPYVLAAIVMAGVIQMILGAAKQGKLGELFPTAVVQGMLAAIGLIIFAKQMHVALGVDVETHSAMDALLEIPKSLLLVNPFIFMISGVSLIILIVQPRIATRFFQLFPGPLLVLLVSIPMAMAINKYGNPGESFMGFPFYLDHQYFIEIPEEFSASFIFPNFSKIGTFSFWITVISIALVASIETLISSKAVDRLDVYGRKTKLNQDLFAVGLSTVASGLIGGLPIITVILRSSVNINHGAQTRWSNFFHGVIILLIVLLVPEILRKIPIASLATILVYSGYKLVSPKIFKNALRIGWEQFVSILVTLLFILITDILWGVIIGIIFTLLIHWMRSELQFSTFFRHLRSPSITKSEEQEGIVHVEVQGICNFLVTLKMIKALQEIPKGMSVVLDFTKSKVVDNTILEHIYEFRDKHFGDESKFDIIGLDNHRTSSSHPFALHVLEKPMHKRLTSRQNNLLHYSRTHKLFYRPEINWDTSDLKRFRFFEHRIIEYTQNSLRGKYDDSQVSWEVCDVSFNEGVLLASEEKNITVIILKFRTRIPAFSMTKENLAQLKSMWKGYLRSNDERTSIAMFTTELIHFLLAHEIYSIEARGNRMLIYKKQRLASFQEINSMMEFSKELVGLMPGQGEVQNQSL